VSPIVRMLVQLIVAGVSIWYGDLVVESFMWQGTEVFIPY